MIDDIFHLVQAGVRAWNSFTPREKEVVTVLCAQGHCDSLGMNDQTLRKHMYNIFDKTGMSSRTELIVFAYKSGMVKL